MSNDTPTPSGDAVPTASTNWKKYLIIFCIGVTTSLVVHITYAISASTYEDTLKEKRQTNFIEISNIIEQLNDITQTQLALDESESRLLKEKESLEADNTRLSELLKEDPLDYVEQANDDGELRDYYNRQAEKDVLVNQSHRATPTIQAAITDIISTTDHPYITNVCGSHGGTPCKEHIACAAIDISKQHYESTLPFVLEHLESLDLVCESHKNYSGQIADLNDLDSHFHCVDKWYLEQQQEKI